MQKSFYERYMNPKVELKDKFNFRERESTKSKFSSPEQILDEILKSDPTEGLYFCWILKQYKSGFFILDDVDQVKSNIEKFEQTKQLLPEKDRNIEKYNYSQLKFIVSPQILPVKSDSIIILRNDEYGLFVIPKTQESFKELSINTNWDCFQINQFGPIYVWYDKKSKQKFLFHFSTIKFLDSSGNTPTKEIFDKFRKEYHVKLFQNEEKKIAKNIGKAVIYSNKIQERFLIAEPAIFNSKLLFDYFMIHGRIKEAEPHILKNPELIYYYCKLLNERWLEAEKIILSNENISYQYALDVIRERWPEAESQIKNPLLLFDYIKNIIKGREPDLEPIIASNPKTASRYAREILKRRWLDVEQTIMNDPFQTCLYTEQTMRGRWIVGESSILKHPSATFRYLRNVMKRPWKDSNDILKDTIYWELKDLLFTKMISNYDLERIDKICELDYILYS